MDINNELFEELEAIFVKHKIKYAFLAIPQIDAECYLLMPYQMGNNAVRHMATSLLQNINAVEPPTLN